MLYIILYKLIYVFIIMVRYLDVLTTKQGRSSQINVNVGAGAIQKEGKS